jgi:hypothetical protein
MIFLDFDGVLFDTAMEAFIVGHKAYYGIDADHKELKNNYRRFLLLRPFVVSAWQYLSVFKLLLEVSNDKLLIAKGKKRLTLKPTRKDREFEIKFNYIRTELIKYDKDKWIHLHKPYKFFTLIKPMMIQNSQQFQIISTKSSNFILELLLVYGVSFDKAHVWGKDEFDKSEQSKAKLLSKNTNIVKKSLFIDDSKKHIIEVNLLKNIETILANWGYVEDSKVEDNTVAAVEKVQYYMEYSCHS